MPSEMTARSAAKGEILRRIRAATGQTPTAATVETEWTALPRGYRQTAALGHDAMLDLFEDRLRDYDARVVRIAPADVASAVSTMLAERGLKRMLAPAGIPAEWLPSELKFSFESVTDDGMSPAELDKFDGVITGSTVAIAETGTIVLQAVPGQGRRALTLVPDYHLCLLRAEDIVETVPEAMARLQATAGLATTFFSGPSATADIEMTRIKGVHGPRFLDVLLVR